MIEMDVSRAAEPPGQGEPAKPARKPRKAKAKPKAASKTPKTMVAAVVTGALALVDLWMSYRLGIRLF